MPHKPLRMGEHAAVNRSVDSSSLPGAAMIADEKAARQKTLKIVRFSRFFAMYAAKTSAYETCGKDNIL